MKCEDCKRMGKTCSVHKVLTNKLKWEEYFNQLFYKGDKYSIHCKKHRSYATPEEIKGFIKFILKEKDNQIREAEERVRNGIMAELALWRPIFYKDVVTEMDMEILKGFLTNKGKEEREDG